MNNIPITSKRAKREFTLCRYTPNDFSFLKLLGKGGSGKVFLVECSNGFRYAAKVMSKEDLLIKQAVRRFSAHLKEKRATTELHILMSLRHPFVLKLFHSMKDDKFLYFIVQYCSRGEFFKLLKRLPDKRIDEASAIFYSSEILTALEYLQTLGIIYRDLKPGRI
ncbi:kinase-like protein [Rozella allomycis CSF55]|uniref:non-specific serine/threonine protein kinase n=1 Tax=Rozella allomycis (strain CSF55) TaxID=988480 RepID=A0A075AWJ5_ROZAC|nr:Protein kinase, ATP binding site domain-containing protein [Rozella allomycis CSF55]RKP21497.1 kinase-like protein [Rozella allomycis CSF55]|eukprot:EPZ34695.1 Protein kinase, ATP binding site domain-containing protein [Rozella allomycis CSF55]